MSSAIFLPAVGLHSFHRPCDQLQDAMRVCDLQFDYPEHLVATEPRHPPRVLWVDDKGPLEITLAETLARIPAGDILVVNNTRVLKRRVFAGDLEILFLSELTPGQWEVLFPSKKFSLGEEIALPLGRSMKLVKKGRPQVVEVQGLTDENYFEQVAELPLPPYIQKARGERHATDKDAAWYQTAWARHAGSFAAPTASLHFQISDLEALRARGVHVLEVTLHVGLGTFLPVVVEDLDHHPMHEEYYEVSRQAWQEIEHARQEGRHIWALGTTVARTLESAARGELQGLTRILLQPGTPFLVVDRLMTNFHQPASTLLALVCGFAGVETVREAYSRAIEKEFRLFSYGDLSVWIGA